MKKIVLDTNLLVAAFFNKNSASFKLVKKVKKGKIKFLWTEAIKNEASFILGNIKRSVRKRVSKDKFSLDLEELFLPESKIENPPQVKVVEDDPEDDKFLACAQKGEADLIVSNDSHLLKLKKYKNIPIKNPSYALKYLNE